MTSIDVLLSHLSDVQLNPITISHHNQPCLSLLQGDLMSPPKLENLLVVPTGCGEQNMARTAINFVMAKYLDSTKQLTPAIRARMTGNLKLGENS